MTGLAQGEGLVTGLAQAAARSLTCLLADAEPRPWPAATPRSPGRQPVHTTYVAADRFVPGPAPWRFRACAPDLPQASDISGVLGLPLTLAADVQARVAAKLAAEPVEDLRLDFEDGYGHRGDAAEDADARAAATTLAAETTASHTPPFCGLRCQAWSRAPGGGPSPR